MSKKDLLVSLLQIPVFRPSWTEYFMSLALLSSKRSTCHRLQVGCVLVKDNHVISSGYNGFLAGTPHESYIRDNHEQNTVHAEANCISDCAKRGIPVDQAIVYITHFPCLNCTKLLISSGIQKIVYFQDYKNDELVHKMLDSKKIKIYQFSILNQEPYYELKSISINPESNSNTAFLSSISSCKNLDFNYPFGF